MKSVLITGGAGFIGANFVEHFINTYTNYKVIVLDKLTYAADRKYLSAIEDNSRFTFVEGDITDSECVERIFLDYDISDVIHFAAESHVDNSILGPSVFVKTNIEGTFVLLETARKFWMNSPGNYKQNFLESKFHHISTDEVYGTLGKTGLFTEQTPYAPNSPYSASKASSDFLVRSYFHTYGLNCVTTNCSNNYGPRQHSEKLIPVIINNCIEGNSIPIYGDGLNVRDWLYVLDHCKGIDLAFHKGKPGETYNIGGRNEKTNLEIVHAICSHLDSVRPRGSGKTYSDLISFVKDRPGHDKRYAIDATKIEKELGWCAEETFDTGIVKTIDWYLKQLEKN